MWTYGKLQPVTLVLAACLSLAVEAPSSAQTPPFYGDRYESWSRIAHDNGYRAGFERGEADARARLDFNYTRDPDFQRADIGYRRDLTSLDRYRRVFREGYAAGYEEAYQRYAETRGVRQPSGITGGVRRSPSLDIAFEYGFADGFKAGVEDARDNDRFEPTDHDAYRDADRGYERRYGAREVYRVEYRDGFHTGYARGYREGRP
jgi:hypothetical protein